MKLKDLAKIKLGYPFRGRIPEVPESNTIVVQLKNISALNGIDWEACIKNDVMPSYTNALDQNDVLFAARGNQNNAVAIGDYLINKPYQAVASPHFYVIKVNPTQALPEYIAWFLNQRPSKRYFDKTAEGSAMRSIRREVLDNTPIALPSLEKQKTIIKMAKNINQQQHIAEQLIHTNQKLSNAIADQLIKEQARGA